MLKCYACKLAFIYWIVHELSSTRDITRFSFLLPLAPHHTILFFFFSSSIFLVGEVVALGVRM